MDLVAPIFVASLLGSSHCAAMCGPFVAFYSGQTQRGASHLAYNLGRLLCYVTLGIAAGALGSALDLAGDRLLGVQRVAAWVTALLMIAWGVVGVLRVLRPAASRGGAGPWHGLLLRLTRGLRERPPIYRAFFLGVSTALLPCGWLYAFVLAAAGTGGALRGALAMTAFWAGSLPALAALGLAVQRLSGALRRHLAVVSAVALIAIGGVGLARRAPIGDKPAPSCHGHP